MNLVNHAWAFNEFTGARKVQHVPTCIIPVVGVNEVLNGGVKFGAFRLEYMSMHFKAGCLSLSPNNHKVLVKHDYDVCKFWTLSICASQAKAIVTLQWVITRDGVDKSAFFNAQELSELIQRVDDPVIWNLFRNLY